MAVSLLEAHWGTLDASARLLWAIAVVSTTLWVLHLLLACKERHQFSCGSPPVGGELSAAQKHFGSDGLLLFLAAGSWVAGALLRHGVARNMSFVTAAMAGLAVVLLVQHLRKAFGSASASAQQGDFLNQRAMVVRSLPPDGTGKGSVQIHLHHVTTTFEAITYHPLGIRSGATVLVREVLEDGTLVVIKA